MIILKLSNFRIYTVAYFHTVLFRFDFHADDLSCSFDNFFTTVSNIHHHHTRLAYTNQHNCYYELEQIMANLIAPAGFWPQKAKSPRGIHSTP